MLAQKQIEINKEGYYRAEISEGGRPIAVFKAIREDRTWSTGSDLLAWLEQHWCSLPMEYRSVEFDAPITLRIWKRGTVVPNRIIVNARVAKYEYECRNITT